MTKRNFKDAYGVLQRHSEALRNHREPNIDDLLTIVTESVEAYKVCKSRIDAVEKALEEALGGAGVEAASGEDTAPGVQQPPQAPAVRSSALDDDVPL